MFLVGFDSRFLDRPYHCSSEFFCVYCRAWIANYRFHIGFRSSHRTFALRYWPFLAISSANLVDFLQFVLVHHVLEINAITHPALVAASHIIVIIVVHIVAVTLSRSR